MSKPPSPKSTRAKAAGKAPPPRVAVLGGGLAGLNASLQLLKAGFAVTLIEADPILGGNTSSEKVGETEHDVYPHMFCDWYANFWDMFENELGLSRKAHFEARPGVKMLAKGEKEFSELFNPTSLAACIANLKSGAMKPAEMLLLGFSELDLLSFPFERSGVNQLQQLDVNGFLYSRGYATEPVAKMENYILSLIWSINSEQTAAATYQNFLRHAWQFPNHAPFAWMLRGSLSSKLVDPLEARLRELGCDIRLNTQATSIRLIDDKPVVTMLDTGNWEDLSEEKFDYLVCAVPAPALAGLCMSGTPEDPGKNLVEAEPDLSNLQRLDTVAIPVVDLYLTEKLAHFPKESIGLAGSRFGLTALDISQLWDNVDFAGRTALVLAASEGASIPSANLHHQGWLVIKELSEFFPAIRPGNKWGDPDANIDWDKTFVRNNLRHKLFLNDVGSWAWRPASWYPNTLRRVAFAGDLCLNEVDMATIEGAVISGISAARAIQLADGDENGGKQRGKPIQALPHTVYSNAAFRAAKLWFLPAAYTALGVAAFDQWKQHRSDEGALKRGNHYPLLDYLALVPLQFTIDWWKGVYWLGRSLFDKEEYPGLPDGDGDFDDGPELILTGARNRRGVGPDELANEPGQPRDHEIGLGTAILMVLGECADYAIDHFAAHPKSRKESPVGGLVEGVAGFAKSFLGGLEQPTGAKHRRRWRHKH